jgi:glycosyltransferase involved in cell wall biosynthesis
MKVLVASPSTGIYSRQVGCAFAEHEALEAFFTTYGHDPNAPLARLLQALPGRPSAAALRELGRRTIAGLPAHLVETRPWLELARTLAARAGADRRVVDRIWDRMIRDFTRAAARRIGRSTSAVYAYEYSALECFEAADRRGIAKVLDLPSLNSRRFAELQQAQREAWPELAEPADAYFDARFEGRQARRDAEVASADLIVTNSALTRASHVAAGADPERTFAIPLGAPPPVARTVRTGDGPLRCIWAGPFSVRKGAHLLIEAWRRLAPGGEAALDIYGALLLPEKAWHPAPPGVTFHGSVPQQALSAAYAASDVLILPTLSDGFGMVITEAMSRGVPAIVTDQAGAADLLRDKENGLLIPAGDVEAIVEALRWCLDHRERMAGLGEAALDTAKGWQWSDYRAALYATVTVELGRQGKRL